jgi:hypothetical protein
MRIMHQENVVRIVRSRLTHGRPELFLGVFDLRAIVILPV